VLISNRRRFTAPRVYHHHFAAPGLNGLKALLHIWHGHNAAVGSQRVATQDQHKVGVIDVRDRQQQTMAVHQVAGEVMRQLIHRGRGIPIARLEQAEEVVAVSHQPIVVHAGVALIHRHRILPVPGLDTRQPLGDQGKRFVPRDRSPFAARSQHRLVEAVRVILDILQRHRLWADMTTAEGVQRVALDRGNRQAAVFGLGSFQGQATDGFT